MTTPYTNPFPQMAGGPGPDMPSGYGGSPRNDITQVLLEQWNRGQGGAMPTNPLSGMMPPAGAPTMQQPLAGQGAPGSVPPGAGAQAQQLPQGPQLPQGMAPQNLVAQNLQQPYGQPARPTPPGGGFY